MFVIVSAYRGLGWDSICQGSRKICFLSGAIRVLSLVPLSRPFIAFFSVVPIFLYTQSFSALCDHPPPPAQLRDGPRVRLPAAGRRRQGRPPRALRGAAGRARARGRCFSRAGRPAAALVLVLVLVLLLFLVVVVIVDSLDLRVRDQEATRRSRRLVLLFVFRRHCYRVARRAAIAARRARRLGAAPPLCARRAGLCGQGQVRPPGARALRAH
jgi:hypothetical protein